MSQSLLHLGFIDTTGRYRLCNFINIMLIYSNKTYDHKNLDIVPGPVVPGQKTRLARPVSTPKKSFMHQTSLA